MLPDVDSTIVPPGFNCPRRSASITIRSAVRSLTDPAGFIASSLATTVHARPAVTRLRRTSGVPPTVPRTSSWIIGPTLPRSRSGFTRRVAGDDPGEDELPREAERGADEHVGDPVVAQVDRREDQADAGK